MKTYEISNSLAPDSNPKLIILFLLMIAFPRCFALRNKTTGVAMTACYSLINAELLLKHKIK
jgi:hypothetical protein